MVIFLHFPVCFVLGNASAKSLFFLIVEDNAGFLDDLYFPHEKKALKIEKGFTFTEKSKIFNNFGLVCGSLTGHRTENFPRP